MITTKHFWHSGKILKGILFFVGQLFKKEDNNNSFYLTIYFLSGFMSRITEGADRQTVRLVTFSKSFDIWKKIQTVHTECLDVGFYQLFQIYMFKESPSNLSSLTLWQILSFEQQKFPLLWLWYGPYLLKIMFKTKISKFVCAPAQTVSCWISWAADFEQRGQ